jgi:hypothetical protein
MAKWQIALVAAFVVIFGVTVILTGNPIYLIAAVMIAALVIGWSVVNRGVSKKVADRHDSLEDAMSDESEPIPSTHLIPDNETAAGDTPEAHDEINPPTPAGRPPRHRPRRSRPTTAPAPRAATRTSPRRRPSARTTSSPRASSAAAEAGGGAQLRRRASSSASRKRSGER